MLSNFFKLNDVGPVKPFDEAAFIETLRTSKHVCNVLYAPSHLKDQKISRTTFENVSFSKTELLNLTFHHCHFKDCLFIGTVLQRISFHQCSFTGCNFYKSTFKNVYAKPYQFRKAIESSNYANVAVHLYQQLRENYHAESQREFKNEAEFYFKVWSRKNDFMQAKRDSRIVRHLPAYVISWAYWLLFGYGYRVRHLFSTTLALLGAFIIINHHFSYLLVEGPEATSWLGSLYFTITTMTTLGSVGFEPTSKGGYLLIVLNVLAGITILSNAVTTVFKRIVV